jgi:hypothetical protein
MNRLPQISKILLLPLLCWLTTLPVFGQAQQAGSYQPPPLTMEFAPQGGFFTDSVTVQLLAPGAVIYFTTDGSRPRETSAHRYRLPLKIGKTTVVRAFAVQAGEKSTVFSQTYFMNEPESTLPVISISITSDMLFDPEIGLFVKGPNAVDSLWYLPGANFWSRREITANFEFYEPDGKCEWHSQVGLRVFGGMSRIFPQKSIAIVARNRYGDSRIRHQVFGKNGLKKFKYLVLRNSGSDFGRTHFRDALMTDLVKNWDLDLQDYRPAHVYINGKYWGIYNIREKVNRHFLASHHEVAEDSIDFIEHKLTRQSGSTSHYRRLLDFLEKNSLANAANFAYVNSQMETSNFLDLQLAQIYFDNQDAGGNIKFWRPQTPNGRWRWILFDTDWGFGLNDPKAYQNNSLAFHTEPNGPHWPNPPWSTFILRKLLENKDFERQFINRFADRLNSDFESSQVLARIDKFYQRLLPEMPRHLDRWRLSRGQWEKEVEVLRTFARERPAYIRRFLMEKFNTGELRNLSLGIAHGGRIFINETVESRDTFAGQYFEKIPIRLRAVPDLGYRFVRWEGEEVRSESPEFFLQLSRPDWHIRAVFEKYEHPLTGKIIINEISCNNKQSGDWVELYNHSRERIDLDGWILADRKNEFRFPTYTLLPGGYVVVCEDSVKFLKNHPDVQSLIGGLSFGLNKRREVIQLFSPDASAVDSVGYELEPEDSIFTLNLLLPRLDNGDPENWELTPGTGSPGAANAYYLTSSVQIRQSRFIQIGGALGVLCLGLILLWLRRKGYV